MGQATEYQSPVALERREKRAVRRRRKDREKRSNRDRLSVGDVVVFAIPPLEYGTIVSTCKLVSVAELCGHATGDMPTGFRVQWVIRGIPVVTRHAAFELRSVAKFEEEGFDE